MAQPSDVYAPRRPVPGKPVVQKLPTPNLDDRIYVVRKESRVGAYEVPAKGSAFKGPDAAKFEGFVFSTAVPSDQTGWVDWYYLNERENQDDYNYVIDYPYTDHDYPRYTRTYVLLRTDVVEPTSDDVDPVFNSTITPDGPELLLTDHKQVRLEDPILDSLFVGVQRVYERLPGPIITTYSQNEFKQIVTTETQAIETEDLPIESDAVTEVIKTERTGTAKAEFVVSRVPDVFDRINRTHEWGSQAHGIPLEFRSRIPLKTTSQVLAGDAVEPVTISGDILKTERQATEYTKEVVITHFDVIPLESVDKRINAEGQVVTITKTIDPSDQTPDTGALVVGGGVEKINETATLKTSETVPVVFPRLDVQMSRRDVIPPEFSAQVPVFEEAISSEGQPENPPTLGPGILKHREYQLGDFTKRIEVTRRDFGTLPQELIDKKLTEEYGGGILDIIRTVDDTILEPEEGYDVVSSFVKNLGDGVMVRETERVEGGVWPTLYGIHTEESGIYAGIVTGFDKTVVPASEGLILPDPGTYIEVTPIDKWRSIRIASRIQLLSLPAPKTYATSTHLSLPSVLDSVVANWTRTGGKNALADDGFRRTNTFPAPTDGGKAEVDVSDGAMGSVAVLSHAGYRGSALAYLTRYFFNYPPTVADINAATAGSIKLIKPSSGTATLVGKHVTFSQTVGKDVGANGNRGELRRETLEIGPFLTNSLNNVVSTFPLRPTGVSATSGAYTATLVILPGPPCEMRVDIPASTPASIVSGQQIFIDAPVTEWRFGVHVLEVIVGIVP